MKYLYLSALLVLSCTLKPTKNGVKLSSVQGEVVANSLAPDPASYYEDYHDLDLYVVAEIPGNTPVLTIDSTCAIMIDPDEKQLKRMKEDYGDDFYVIANDNWFFKYEASAKLDSSAIDVIATKKRFIKLRGRSETWLLDVKQDDMPEWNLIFFHRSKKPEIVSTVDVTYDRIDEYFMY